ncbi:MAG: M36 family metallopeptidase [Blastocatellales bacterium]
MKKSLILIAAILVAFSALSITLSTTAQIGNPSTTEGAQDATVSAQRSRPRSLEDFDIRASVARSLSAREDQSREASRPRRTINARQSRLLRERPGAQMRLSSLTGTPSRIFGLQQPLSEGSQADAEVTARQFIKNNRDLFRLSDGEVDRLKVARRRRSAANRVTHLLLQQQVNQIEVFQGEYAVHVDRDGAIIAASGELMPEASQSINLARPRLSVIEALRKAAEYADVEIKGSLRPRKQAAGKDQRQLFSREENASAFARDVEARLVYFPLSPGQMRLAWEFVLWKQETPDAYLILVDAERGSLLYRYNMTLHCFEQAIPIRQQIKEVRENAEHMEIMEHTEQAGNLSRDFSVFRFFSAFRVFPLTPKERRPNHFAASTNSFSFHQTTQTPHGLVFTKDSPRPDVPHVSNNPAIVAREDVPFRPAPFNGSTIFNPGDPHLDWWAGQAAAGLTSNNVDAYLDRDSDSNQPDQPRLMAADGNFSFPIDFTQQPATENNQKAAQVNLFYWINRYHDILYAYGFDEAAGNFQTNNFGLGQPGTGNDAIRAEAQDGSGTNNANFSTPRDGSPGRVQMFLWTTANPQLDGDFDQGVIIHELTHGLSNRLVGNATGLSGIQSRGMGEGWSDYFGLVLLRNENDDLDGAYAVGQYVQNNYSRGIRRFPYSTNTQVYPLNFGDIALSAQVHRVGEIWCNTLLEMRALLIRRHGFQEGQRQSIQLVVDGLGLTPNNPTFIDARDAIMQADKVNNSGANQCLIWQAFSKRGMGFSARTIDSNDSAPVESFEASPSCSDLGSIRFNQKNYLIGETMEILVGDRNASGPVRVTVKSSMTNDQETITLTQDGIFNGAVNGLFAAKISVVAGRASSGDGLLQASLQAGDKIVATYDDANNGGGSTAQATLQTEVVGEVVAFEDDIEMGNKGWNTGGTTTSTWAITSASSASPSKSWTDSPGANYANNSNTYLVSPLFDLSRAAGVTLSFAHSYDFESSFDFGIVEYSIDDGANWNRATAFTGAQTNFTQARVNLDALAGQSRARVRFRLQSDNTNNNNRGYDGWTIDDIRIIARSSDLNYLPPQNALSPVISGVSPASGLPGGNNSVTINGANFTETGDVRVFFDNIPATNLSVIGASVITAKTPPHGAGAVTVRVETRNGAATLANAFTYYVNGSVTSAPELMNIFPASGAARGGTSVIVYGSNFTPQTSVAFGSQNAAVTFISSNTLRVVAPASPNNATDVVDVIAANPQSPQAKLTGAFNYVAPTPPSVKVLALNGGETVFAGGTVTLRWQSSDNKAVARHRIELRSSSGATPIFVANIANDVSGEAQSLNWTIPINTATTTTARILVVAVDDEGTETEAYSSGDFTIDRRWASSVTLPEGFNRHAVTADNQYLYTIGGRRETSNSTAVSVVQRLDLSASAPAWSALAPLPVELNAIEAVTIQSGGSGKIYVPGGFTQQTEIDRNLRIYDIASNSWSAQTPPPTGVGQYAIAADAQQGIFYVTGGSDLTGPVTNVQAYDTGANTWQALPPMMTARFGHEAALINGKLYVAGGSGGVASCEVYDFQTGQWSPIASLNQPRFHAINAVARNESGQLFWLVIGGADPSNTSVTLNSAEAYDVTNNRWIVLDGSFALPSARTFFNGAVHGGFFYAVGGAATTSSGSSLTANERLKLDGFTLINPNQPPLVVVPAAQQIAIPNQELKFTVSAQDLGSGAPISLTAEGLPGGAVFNAANDTNNAARGGFRWTPQSSDAGANFTVDFTASDGILKDVKSVVIRVVSAAPLTSVNAADFRIGPLAADSIAAAFGANLANRIEIAQSLPLPTQLAGTTLTVNGVPAPLFFVSPTQINFVVPPALALIDPGPAAVIVSSPTGTYSLGNVQIVASAPAIFTADATGKGDAAALATTDGVNFLRQPFDVLINGKPNVLVLFGTGIRRAQAAAPNDDNGVAESVAVTIDGSPARTLYAGAQGSFSGLDQINVEMPPALANTGPRRVEVVVTVNNVAANRVTIQIK